MSIYEQVIMAALATLSIGLLGLVWHLKTEVLRVEHQLETRVRGLSIDFHNSVGIVEDIRTTLEIVRNDLTQPTMQSVLPTETVVKSDHNGGQRPHQMTHKVHALLIDIANGMDLDTAEEKYKISKSRFRAILRYEEESMGMPEQLGIRDRSRDILARFQENPENQLVEVIGK